MNLLQETRVVLTLILLACIGLIATAFYMEYQLGLEPCPMCIVQRTAVALAGAAALIGILHDQRKGFLFAAASHQVSVHMNLAHFGADTVDTM